MICTCFEFIRQWRIQTQVLFFQLMIITLIILIYASLIHINLNQLQILLDEIQNKLLENIQMQRLSQESNSINQQSKQYFEYGVQQLERINQLYLFSQKPINLTFQNVSISCPQNVESKFLIQNLPYFCYAYQNSTNPFEVVNDIGNQSLINFIDLMNILLLKGGAPDYSIQIYFTHINSTQFFSISPVNPYYPEYRPHSRPWFQNHIKQMNISHKSYYISDFYTDYINQKQQLTLTKSLEDVNGHFQGVIGIDFYADQMYIFHQSNALTISLQGQILQQNNQSQLYYFIYDKEFTGYSLEDWKQIQYQLNSQNGTSNCQTNFSGFCRFNSLYNQDLILDVYKLFDKFYLIIYVDVRYLQESQELVLQMRDQFLDSIVIYAFVFASVSIILMVTTWFLIKVFLNPYSELNEQTLESLFQQKNPKHCEKTKDIYKKINLQNFQSKMFQMKNTRSKECLILEKFKYPKQSVQLQESVQNQISKLYNIPERQNSAQYLQIYLKIRKQYETAEDIISDYELKEEVDFRKKYSS